MTNENNEISITLGFDDHDSYYTLGPEHTTILATLPLDEMTSYVVDNGKPLHTTTDETDIYICSEVEFVDSEEEKELRLTLKEWND